GQMAGRLPAVAEVPGKLPLATRHQDMLEAFLHRIRQAQHKRSIRVELIRRRSADQSRYATAKAEQSSGAATPFRLPVVQVLESSVKSPPTAGLAPDRFEIDRSSKTLILEK